LITNHNLTNQKVHPDICFLED